MTLRTHVDSRGYDHAALLYHSEREYVDRLVQFISDGLELQEPSWSRFQGTDWHRCAALWAMRPPR